MYHVIPAIDRFLERIGEQQVNGDVAKTRRRKQRPTTLHLMERAHGQVLTYHTTLLRSFDAGVRDLALLVRNNDGRHSIQHSMSGMDVISRMRRQFIDAAHRHYTSSFELGRSYVSNLVGRETLTPEHVRVNVSRQEQDNARFVERNLLADVDDRFSRCTALVANHRILKQDEMPIPPKGETEEQLRAREEAERQKRRREMLLALLAILLAATTPEDIADKLDDVEGYLGGTAQERDAAVLEAAATLDDVQADAVRAAYAGAVMDDLAETQSHRVGMYANRIWTLVNDGFYGEATAAGYAIDWQTTSDDPCPDCIDLENDGPYEQGQLPTLPGGGDTVCLGYCKCILELVSDDSRQLLYASPSFRQYYQYNPEGK